LPSFVSYSLHFASKLKSFKAWHVKELNSRLKLAHTMDFSLRFAKPPVDQIPELVAWSCFVAGSVFHALDFAAHKLHRVAESSKGAETQAAVKALGALRYLSAISLHITGNHVGC
jgi:hypothetical protein